MIRSIVLASVLALAACGTAPAQDVTAAESLCVLIVSAADPAADPLCVFAGELAGVVVTLTQAGAAPVVPLPDAAGRTAVAPDVYAALAAAPAAARARKASRVKCPTLPPGRVSP